MPSSSDSVQVVWLKRDLRVRDHLPLARASERGPVIALYVYEPPLWQREEYDRSHLDFVNDCLRDLDEHLQTLGARVSFRVGRMVPVLDALHRELAASGGIGGLWSHQEVGIGWTWARDRAVGRWCREHGVPWHEATQDGVFRGAVPRDGWAGRWEQRMRRPIEPIPSRIVDVSTLHPDWDHGSMASGATLGMRPSSAMQVQPGGERRGQAILQQFLAGGVEGYRSSLSSPRLAKHGCSRLSVHLAWGSVSSKVVYQRTLRAMDRARRHGETRKLGDLEAFAERLHWRDHFMQKLEDEPAAEHRSLSRLADQFGRDRVDSRLFDAWRTGRTGYPLVDACMRSLEATRWLNFRMRAMVVSFASYHLWLPWQPVARHLASRFLDFEPGIHFPQVQMQSGSTGINSLRIYDPVKQAREQDPDGAFIRTWVPELTEVPVRWIFSPREMPAELAAKLPAVRFYPVPVVPNARAAGLARRRIESVRQTPEGRRESRDIHERHGSRRGAMSGRTRRHMGRG